MQRDLVERAMAGDRDAFTELQRATIDKLFAIARLILRDSDRAQDATQEAYTPPGVASGACATRTSSSRGCDDCSSTPAIRRRGPPTGAPGSRGGSAPSPA